MNKTRLKPFLFILLFITIIHFDLSGADKQNAGRNNYLQLQKMFLRWDSGLFGSRKLYRNRLNRVLIDMIDAEISTGRDYNISLPEILEKKHYSSDLYNNSWLHVHGAVDEKSLLEFKNRGSDYIKEVERNKHLFSLTGKISKFRIVESQYERYKYYRGVHLYLESVKITGTEK